MEIEYYKHIRGYRTPDGWRPSVHAVLDVLEGNGKFLSDEVTEVGIACHAALHRYFLTGETPTNPTICHRIFPVLEWLEGKTIIQSERTYWNNSYAGTIDCLLSRTVVDFKFVEAMLPAYRVQLAAYGGLVDADDFYILQVNRKGVLKERLIDDIEEKQKYFNHAVEVLKYRLGGNYGE